MNGTTGGLGHNADSLNSAEAYHELAPLLLDLGRAGIELAPHPTDAGRLRHRPADLPPDLSARLRMHKAAVLRLLVDGYAPAGDDAGYVLGERLGVADGLGLPTHPGSPARLVAVGEGWNTLDELCDTGTLSDLSPKQWRIEREAFQVEVR